MEIDEKRNIALFDQAKQEESEIAESQKAEKTLASNKKILLVTLCLLVTEMCERLTFYSIMAGLVLYCTSTLKIGQTDATTINQVFTGVAFVLPIIGGFIADSFAGRFKTILGAAVIYIAGTILLPASAIDYQSWGGENPGTNGRTAMFMTGLALVAIGTGGIKANVGPFGAEQVEVLGSHVVQSFFNWFYWVINVGAMIAFTGVAYIQQNISFALGFFVPFVSMILAVCIFVIVKSKYVMTQPKGSILTTAGGICLQGGCKSKPPKNPDLPEGSEKQILARAKTSFGGKYQDHLVDGLVSVIRVTPFCVLVIMYWAINAQMSNTFFAQSERMDIRVGDGSYVPAAALVAFNTISIIILIPIMDRLIYPCLEKLKIPLSYLKRIGIGMLLAAVAVVVAGIVEIYRKVDLEENSHLQVLGGENFTASSMSVFVQIPQFALIGASEIFTSITSMEFAYNQAPVAMQGLLTGLFLAATGVGNWVSTVILIVVQKATEENPWWCDDINHCKMEYLMFLLGGLMLLNFFIFVIVAQFYTYQDPATFEASVSKTDLDNLDTVSKTDLDNLDTVSKTDLDNLDTVSKTDLDNLDTDSKTDLDNLDTVSKTDLDNLDTDSKTDLDNLDTVSKTDLDNLDTDSKTDLDNLDTVSKTDLDNLDTDSKTDLDNLDTDSKTDLDNLDTVSKTDLDNLDTVSKTDLDNLDTDSKTDLDNLDTDSKTDLDNLDTVSKTDLDNLDTDSKTDLDNLDTVSKTDLDNLDTDSKTDLDNLDTDSKTDLDNLDTDSKTDLDNLDTDSKTDLDNLDTDSKTDLDNLDTEIKLPNDTKNHNGNYNNSIG